MSEIKFEALQNQLTQQGAEAVFESLVAQLKADQKYHELFDVLLMRTRHQLGLPVVLTMSLDDLEEPLRTRVEDAYLAACREVGTLLLADGRLREAWMYLRPVGDKALMAQALGRTAANEENLQDLIEIALHEGVSPALGYELVLNNYGTCNAITTFESALVSRPPADQQTAAGMLLVHLHRELIANVRTDIARQAGSPPQESTLAELVADRDWLFADNNYHIDTTHLAATIRYARLIEDPQMLSLAHDLTEYGRRLDKQFQFSGEEPFADVYPSHGLFFSAQLGRNVEEALTFFRAKAETVDPEQFGTAAAEVYIALLARLRRYEQAIETTVERIAPGVRTSGFAPNLHELSRLAGNYEPLLHYYRQHGDLVGYTAGLVERAGQS